MVVFNRAGQQSFDLDDLDALLGRRRAVRSSRNHLAEIAEAELVSAEDSRKASARIRRATQSRLFELPEHSGVDGLALIERLTSDLVSLEPGHGRDGAYPARTSSA